MPPKAGEPVVAFVDATVIPMDRDGALPHTTVVTRGDRIVAVGPTDSTPAPAGATTIDAKGKFIIPGLADMHVHTYDPRQLAMFVTMGVTTIRVMWGDAASIGARDAVEHGDPRLAPSIYTAGEIIDGNPPIWPGSTAVTTAAEATAAVERQHRAGYDYVKVYNLLPADAYAAIVATAAKDKMPVIGHVPTAVGLDGVLAAHQRSVEHGDGMARFAERDDSPFKTETNFMKRLGAYKYADDAKVADAIARYKAAGTFADPTLVVMDRIAHLDHPDPGRPEYAYVPKAMIAGWDPKNDFRFASSGPEQFAAMRGSGEWQRGIVKRLADAGVPILAGTDVGNPWLVPGYSLHDELGLLVASGLTPHQALAAATINAAAFFAAPDELGAVAVGRRADLVVLDADPLADIANTRAIAGVLLRGRWLPAKELAVARDTIAAIYKGDASRFAGVAFPFAQPEFSTVFRAESQFASGEERFSVLGTRFLAETRYDGEGDMVWELELGPAGTGTSLHVVEDGLELTATRAAGRVKVTGHFGADSSIAVDEPIADDELLGGEPTGVDAAWHRKLLGVAKVGDSLTFKLAVLQVRAPVRIDRMTFTATREADETRSVGGTDLAVRVFSIGGAGRIAIDATTGYPVETAFSHRE